MTHDVDTLQMMLVSVNTQNLDSSGVDTCGWTFSIVMQ